MKRKTRLSAAFSKSKFRFPLPVRIEPKLCSASLGIGFGFAPALLIWCLKRAQAPHFIEDAFRVQLALQPLERAIHWFAFSNNDFWHQFTSIPKNSPISTPGKSNLLRPSTPRQMVWEEPLRRPTKKIQPLYLRHPRNLAVKALPLRLARGCWLGLLGSDFALQAGFAPASGAGPPQHNR